MSLVCYNDYSENIRAIHQFLNNNPEIKDECLNLFNESPKAGIVKLTEYLDKVNSDKVSLYCPMLYKKNILNEIKRNYTIIGDEK